MQRHVHSYLYVFPVGAVALHGARLVCTMLQYLFVEEKLSEQPSIGLSSSWLSATEQRCMATLHSDVPVKLVLTMLKSLLKLIHGMVLKDVMMSNLYSRALWAYLKNAAPRFNGGSTTPFTCAFHVSFLCLACRIARRADSSRTGEIPACHVLHVVLGVSGGNGMISLLVSSVSRLAGFPLSTLLNSRKV